MNSVPVSLDESKEYTSDKPFSKEEMSSWLHFDSKIQLFRAIFIAWFSIAIRFTPVRYVVDKEVHKMMDCGDFKNGSTVYACPTCNHVHHVPFTCGSRFCPSCGNLINKQRANAMAERMFDVPHRHIVCTIPDCLRELFKDRKLLNLLVESSYEAVFQTIHEVCPSLDVTPGAIAVIHTFSRNSGWNPHVHMILTMGGITKYGKWFPLLGNFISYEKLRHKFQKILLKKLRKAIGPSFAPMANELRQKYTDGFYVRAAEEKGKSLDFAKNPKKLVKYVARYIGRPCIATSRIDGYDGKYVYFHYQPHDRTGIVYEKILATKFILRLIQHIPDPHFHMVRYYGVYSTTGMSSDRVQKALNQAKEDLRIHFLYSPEGHETRLAYCHWRKAMIRSFHVDPLKCPLCGTEMEPLYIIYRGKPVWGVRTRRRRRPLPGWQD